MATWEHELREMFASHDKDLSGFISKDDIICMLLGADKDGVFGGSYKLKIDDQTGTVEGQEDDQKDPVFKTNLRFLINVIKSADRDGDQKISFEEFKQYINQATDSK